MRDRIIQALRFPTILIREGVELHSCSHSGNYRRQDESCDDCYFEPECAWLFGHDENVSLHDKPLADLVEALEYCYGYMDARATQLGHQSESCRCDACRWLRDAEHLMEALG